MRRIASRLLWIDSIAGVFGAIALVGLSGWLSRWYGLPRSLLVGMGMANLAYATYSGSLARRTRRPRRLVIGLVVANALWAVACALAAMHFAGTATVLGLVHLLGEGLVVGGLAAVEWAQRERLVGTA